MGLDYSARVVPYLGELEAGDGFVIDERPNGVLVVVIDVLGHGEQAAVLAREIERFIQHSRDWPVAGLITALHQHLKGTLGAAATMVFFDTRAWVAEGVGVGNTLMRQVWPKTRSFPAKSGVIGEMLPNLLPFQCSFQPGDMFVFTSDGISENLDEEAVSAAAIISCDAVVGLLFERYAKEFDDATALAIRFRDE